MTLFSLFSSSANTNGKKTDYENALLTRMSLFTTMPQTHKVYIADIPIAKDRKIHTLKVTTQQQHTEDNDEITWKLVQATKKESQGQEGNMKNQKPSGTMEGLSTEDLDTKATHTPNGETNVKAKLRNSTMPSHDSESTAPVVILPGFGAGLAFFYRNYLEIARGHQTGNTTDPNKLKETIYGVDWLGTGRSTRIPFPPRVGPKDSNGTIMDTKQRMLKDVENVNHISISFDSVRLSNTGRRKNSSHPL